MKHVINMNTSVCRVCGLTTATGFTRECLGKPMHPLTMKAVSKGEIDYYDGAFHTKTETKEETISDILKGIADKHGFKLVEVHTPRMQRAGNVNEPSKRTIGDLIKEMHEADTRDDYVPSPDKLEAYEAMEKFINDFMAAKQEPEEYALSKDEIEFLKQIHEHPIPKHSVAKLDLTKDQFIMLYDLRKAGYVYASVDGNRTWIVTPKAETYLKSLSKPAPLVMTTDGIALLTILTEDAVSNDEVTDDEDMVAAADLLVGLGLAIDCGEHLHITPKGHVHIKNLLEMKIN